MLILHAAQVKGNLVLWGEDSEQRLTPPDRHVVGEHPYGTQARLLAKLLDLWRQDAAHTSRERRVQPPRTWRTRPDPFEGVWCDVLSWLQEDPDAKAIALLNRLKSAHPDRFSDTHLRTLQRRVQQWRGIMARELVYAVVDDPVPELPATPELALVGAGPQVLKFQ